MFNTPLWAQTIGAVALLETVKRQSDMPFIRFLAQIRWGEINQHDAQHFIATHTHTEDEVPDSAMFLFATNDEADARNALKLATLPGPDIFFYMMQLARRTSKNTNKREQFDGTLARHRRQVTLRLGARARIWSNYDVGRGIVNGRQCEVVGLVPITIASIVPNKRSLDDRVPVEMAHDPFEMRSRYHDSLLRKSMNYNYTLLSGYGFELLWTGDNDCVELVMKGGDTSVYQCDELHPLAVSRTGSSVHRYHRAQGEAQGTNLDYDEHQFNATRAFCVAVHFLDFPVTEIHVLSPVLCTRSEQIRGNTQPMITQMQMPLVPGYASTVHASQGLTLKTVAISLNHLHDPSLPYVALTRAVAASSTHLVGGLGLEHMRPDPLVICYYKYLRKARKMINP